MELVLIVVGVMLVVALVAAAGGFRSRTRTVRTSRRRVVETPVERVVERRVE